MATNLLLLPSSVRAAFDTRCADLSRHQPDVVEFTEADPPAAFESGWESWQASGGRPPGGCVIPWFDGGVLCPLMNSTHSNAATP